MEMQDRLASGRLLVNSQLTDWFEEYRLYHRKDGKIIKLRDDLLSATRVACMMKRFARNSTYGARQIQRKRGSSIAKGVDFDLTR